MNFLSFTGTTIENGMSIDTMVKAMKAASKKNPNATMDDLPGVICLDWKKSAGKGHVEIQCGSSTTRHDMPAKEPCFLPPDSVVRLHQDAGRGYTITVAPNGTYDFAPGANEALEQPLMPRDGDTPERIAALQWLREGRVGASSYTLCVHLTGVEDPRRENEDDNPWDPSDLNRCVMFFQAVPQARARIDQMAAVSPEWAALVPAWDELEGLLAQQQAGGESQLYERMRELLDRPNRRIIGP